MKITLSFVALATLAFAAPTFEEGIELGPVSRTTVGSKPTRKPAPPALEEGIWLGPVSRTTVLPKPSHKPRTFEEGIELGPVDRTTVLPRPTHKPTPPWGKWPRAKLNDELAIHVPTQPLAGVSGPPAFNITSLEVNGSGCPPDSVSYTLAADRQSVTITFSEFGAEAGPGISASKNRWNCQLTVGFFVPSGFSFAVANVDYRGYYQLDRGVTASQDSLYYFQGQIQQTSAHGNLTGPVDGKEYTYRDTFPLASTSYSPCGQPTVLNINSAVAVSNAKNKTGAGYITTDSIDASLTQQYFFQWQTCSK